VFAEISRQEEIRGKYDVFDDDADVWILDTGNEQVLGVGRYYRGEKLLALFNFSKDPQIAWVHDETMYTDLESGRRCKAGSVKVPAGGYRWLYKKFNS
jgi:amylosucrase